MNVVQDKLRKLRVGNLRRIGSCYVVCHGDGFALGRYLVEAVRNKERLTLRQAVIAVSQVLGLGLEGLEEGDKG